MKKIYIAICLFFIHTAYALPVGNPSEASLYYNGETCCHFCFSGEYCSFGIGFDGDYVFNRHMRTVNHRVIDTTKISTNAAYLAVNLCERVDIFSSLGVSRLSLNTSLGAFNSVDPHPLFEVESGSEFSYRVGARATLWQCHCFSLGVMGQYFATEPNIKRLYIAAGAVSYPDDDLRTRYSEWQVSSGLSYRFNDFFVPYAAVRYGHCYWKLGDGENFIIESNTNTFLFNLKNQRNWGYAVGLTLCPLVCKKAAVTVEARFPNEKALYVNGQIRF